MKRASLGVALLGPLATWRRRRHERRRDDRLAAAVALLPEPCREVYRLHCRDGVPLFTIAAGRERSLIEIEEDLATALTLIAIALERQ